MTMAMLKDQRTTPKRKEEKGREKTEETAQRTLHSTLTEVLEGERVVVLPPLMSQCKGRGNRRNVVLNGHGKR